jgi:hypothetical protein
MRPSIVNQVPGPLLALGVVTVAVALNGALMAAEPAPTPAPAYVPRAWPPRGSVPPQGPFFGRPAVPRPWPVPVPVPVPVPSPYLGSPRFPWLPTPTRSGLSGSNPIGATDRNLVVASPAIDPRFLQTPGEVDPGIFASPRVQGLPIRSAGR